MKFNWINKGMNKVLNKESASAYRLTPNGNCTHPW